MTKTRSAVIALAAAMLAAACTGTTSQPAPSPQAPAEGCAAKVLNDELPVWARAGFSGDAKVPHSFGRDGQIVAILFGFPLSQPPSKDRSNKILWVAGPAGQTTAANTDLVIEARLDGRGDAVERKVQGGPGPSIVDLPQPGCWRLALAWGGRTDTIDLEYHTP